MSMTAKPKTGGKKLNQMRQSAAERSRCHSVSRRSALFAVSVMFGTSSFAGQFDRPVEARTAHPVKISYAEVGGPQSRAEKSRGTVSLVAMMQSGKELGVCPLTHTAVTAKVSGYIAHVSVKQTFENSFKEPIDAVYTFPLSSTGAVDEMTMQIGKRKIHGTIKKREEAREIYNQARSQGRIASLLDQERTNIFTQSVANIPPGEKIEVTLEYVETLPFEKGKFSFAFPTVVGPRFNPGTPVSVTGTGREPDTTEVPDASKITPPVAESRSGHDISIAVSIDAGVPISDISSKLHEIKIDKKGADAAQVSLKDINTIPNKDFVLSWQVSGDALKSGYLTHKDASDKSGYFTLMLLPPKRIETSAVAPKEMIFLIDCSGSQSGKPIEKAKETLLYIVDHMNPQDTFQIVAFNNTSRTLFDKPQAVSNEMKQKAKEYIESLVARGGTWMAPAVEKVCAIPADDHRLRIVTFMTDGFVGNDLGVLGLIKKLRDTSRWFSFGTGNSVNRLLIDGIAQEGGGEADYVLLNSNAEEVGRKFYEHISTPVLTDVKIDFGSLSVKEVFPKETYDVWAERPLYFKGRYEHAGKGTVTLSGFAGGKPYKQTLNVTLPEVNESNQALASIWARAKVDRLMREDYTGVQHGQMNKELQTEITDTALKYHIMSQFTSFVAVDESTAGTPAKKTVVVPTDMPDGVSREMTIGGDQHYSSYSGSQPQFGMHGFNAGAPMARMKAMHAPAQYQQMRATPMMSYPAPAPGGASAEASKGMFDMAAGTSKVAGNLLAKPDARGTVLTDAEVKQVKPSSTNEQGLKKEDKPVEQSESDRNREKLSVELRNLIAGSDHGGTGTVKVVINLSEGSDEVLAKLKNAGLTDIHWDAGTKQLTATVVLPNLLKVIALKEVISVQRISDRK